MKTRNLLTLTKFLFIYIFFFMQIVSSQIDLNMNSNKEIKVNDFLSVNTNITSNSVFIDFLDYSSPSNSSSTAIELPVQFTLDNLMTAQLCIGTPKQCFIFQIDTGSNFLWVADFYSDSTPDMMTKFVYNISSTYKNTSIPFEINYGSPDVSASGYISTDSLNFGNYKLDNFSFSLAEKEFGINSEIDGKIGMGYLNEANFKSSFIDQLFESKLINKKIFSFKISNVSEGIMYIGNLADEISNDISNYGTCDVISKIAKWKCNIRAFYFGENENKTENVIFLDHQYASFESGINYLNSPQTFYKKLKDNYFKDTNCTMIDTGNSLSYTCPQEIDVSNLPPLNFVLNDLTLRMHSDELWSVASDNSHKFNLAADKNNDNWIIGQNLLKKFHTVFDKDNGVVGFYGTKDKFKSNLPYKRSNFATKIIFIILGVLIALMLISGLIFVICKKRRELIENSDPSIFRNLST